MTFRRTSSGLSNLGLFYGVDTVVFLEGGNQSLSRDDVEAGMFSASSPDVRFWQTLFDLYRPGTRIQFRSVGSKTVVKSIARDIRDGSVTGVVVAMDRDFDHINNDLIASQNVIYTNGYSWENDVWWCDASLFSACCAISGSCKSNLNDEKQFIRRSLTRFEMACKGAVRADAILSQYGDSLFDKKKPARYVVVGAGGCPHVNTPQLSVSFKNVRKRNPKPVVGKSVFITSVGRDCFGHFLA